MHRYGIIRITRPLLERWLCIPKGHRVVNLNVAFQKWRKCVEVLIEGPMMPEVREDEDVPIVELTFREDGDKTVLDKVEVSEDQS